MSDLITFQNKIPDFQDIEIQRGYVTACIYKKGRVTSMLEEQDYERKLIKAGASGIELVVRTAGMTKYRFRVSYLTKVA